jgi:hypothetical protein
MGPACQGASTFARTTTWLRHPDVATLMNFSLSAIDVAIVDLLVATKQAPIPSDRFGNSAAPPQRSSEVSSQDVASFAIRRVLLLLSDNRSALPFDRDPPTALHEETT